MPKIDWFTGKDTHILKEHQHMGTEETTNREWHPQNIHRTRTPTDRKTPTNEEGHTCTCGKGYPYCLRLKEHPRMGKTLTVGEEHPPT